MSISLLSAGRRISSSNIGLHPEARRWSRRVVENGGSASPTTLAAVSSFCTAIEAAGIRDRFYRLNLFCGDNLAACLVPLYRGQSLAGPRFGNAVDSNENFVSGDYAETGTSGGLGTGATNSTKSLDTGFVPFNAGLVHSDSHMSFYSRQGNTSTGSVMASGFAVTSTEHWQWFINGTSGSVSQFYRSGGQTNSGIEGSFALRTGHLIAIRSGSIAAIIRNGTNLSLAANTTTTATWTTGRPQAVRVFARRFVVSNADSTDQRIATTLQAYSMGAAMTDAQGLAYHNALQAFQTALGRQL